MTLRTVTLHGSLAKKFGTTPVELDADNTSVLISGLCCVLPDFEQEFRRNTHFQLYRINRETKKAIAVTAETFGCPLGDETELHLIPTAEGNGIEIAGMMGLTGFAAFAVGMVINMGISMVMSAIAKKLSPMPSTSAGFTPAAEKPSFIFNQVTNVITPGNPVPLIYGECLAGSYQISVGVTSEKITG